ncbi:AMP-dependent acyl-CoA synthetase [Virgisporangium aliadipatigenens]|uniref:AMP-dependent acyl-CoA synthetase n=1 Tax=Virgisporangium aliadipatigenens TaxID=741659 RepID=A0A8J4DUV5_9ACTN|nr:AMP-binding protein [Virgisporangium aliadipatigenens]GIJ51685.1 AMP-dependent acyl-CoA synthetase [Virgisporangium aliadipatigenens]
MSLLVRFDDLEPALIDGVDGAVLTHAALAARVERLAPVLGSRRCLVFVFADPSVHTAVHYLAAIENGHAVALLDGSAPLGPLLARYRPEVVVHPPGTPPPDGYHAAGDGLARSTAQGEPPHPDLAVLLTTSGSTGSPKFVRLSRENIASNAAAIAASLGLTRADRAVSSLPLHYSYGMSVLHSHLWSGGSVLLTPPDVLSPDFWATVRRHGVTFFGGVPATYEILHRLRFDFTDQPALRALTQAGGRLSADLVNDFAARVGGRFYVMYGQTETSPRMTCLPPERLPDKPGSVGPALPGGTLTVRGPDGLPLPAGRPGAVHYTGPNVMLGYAHERADLSLGDVQGDTIDTGDLGHLDDEGYLYVTGRTRRIGKLFGTRLNLDEVEGLLHGHGPVAAVNALPDELTLFCAWGDPTRFADARRSLASTLRLPPRALRFVHVDTLPVLASGKTDYRRLAEQAAS